MSERGPHAWPPPSSFRSAAMSAPADELQSLSTKLTDLESDDLPGLADAHSSFEKVLEAVNGEAAIGASDASAIAGGVDRGRKLLEALILNEADDAERQLQAVREVAEEMARLLGGDAPAPVPASAPSTGKAASIGGILTNDFEATFAEAEAAPAPEVPASLPDPEPEATSPSGPMSLMDDDLPLVVEFVTEANGHLEQAEQDLLVLEDTPDDKEAISSLFRAFHTIKGVAGFLNLQQIQSLAHATENLLDNAREGKLQLTGGATSIVLESLDLMKQLVADLDTAAKSDKLVKDEPRVTPLSKSLNDYVAACERGETPPELVAKPVGDSNEDRRAGEDRRATAATGDGTVKVATNRLDSLIDTVGELVIANSMVFRDLGTSLATDPRLSRNVGQLGKIVRELQDLSMSLRMVQVGNVFRKMTRVVRDVSQKAGKQAELHIVGGDTELDRNVVDALGDPLVHMVRNSVDHGIEPADERVAAGKPAVGRVELRASHKGGAINIEIADDGRGLKVDRILEKARKNGVIGPDEVVSDADALRLIFHPGLSTAEKITDISGRGVGMDVVKRNIESLRGRIDISSTPGQGSVFTIRLPLTLAVIDGLIVRVGPRPDASPLERGQRYILPINSVEQSLRPQKAQLSTVQGRGELCMVRGELLPLVRLHNLFGVEPKTIDPTEALVVIVQDNDRRCCLLVDELLGQEQVVIKSLGQLGQDVGPIRGVSGGAVLGDGTVSLILDVPGLIELANE